MTAVIETISQVLIASKRPSVLTGAGISRESGIPTYRSGDDARWSLPEVRRLATVAGMYESPVEAWNFFYALREQMCAAQPNAGHTALVELATLLPGLPIITQNVDDLHERAGSRAVIHLHGLITQTRCSRYCHGIPSIIEPSRIDTTSGLIPPHCPDCNALLRPHITLFGEYLHSQPIQTAEYICAQTDCLLVIGTSGIVAPASELPQQAKLHGATIIEINPQPSAITPLADYWLPASSGEALTAILKVCRALLSSSY